VIILQLESDCDRRLPVALIFLFLHLALVALQLLNLLHNLRHPSLVAVISFGLLQFGKQLLLGLVFSGDRNHL
jgi:sugar phosphate permease